MRARHFEYENEKVIQLYISSSESTDTKVLNKIEEIKREYKNNVVVFISGDKEILPSLKQMIIHQKNLIKSWFLRKDKIIYK